MLHAGVAECDSVVVYGVVGQSAMNSCRLWNGSRFLRCVNSSCYGRVVVECVSPKRKKAPDSAELRGSCINSSTDGVLSEAQEVAFCGS